MLRNRELAYFAVFAGGCKGFQYHVRISFLLLLHIGHALEKRSALSLR